MREDFTFVLVKPSTALIADEVLDEFVKRELKISTIKPFKNIWANPYQIRQHFRSDNAEYTRKMGAIFCKNCRSLGVEDAEIYRIIGLPAPREYNLDYEEIMLAAGKCLFEKNRANFLSGTVVPALISGAENIVAVVRNIVGPTNPIKCSPETIRGKYASGVDIRELNLVDKPWVDNAIHASDSPENALREAQIWCPQLV